MSKYYNSKTDTLYKLSPSDFAYLWNDCKHCYYQKVKSVDIRVIYGLK
ncbi:MAG: hypothetical protein Q7R77_02975 [Candidatus Daviesbacteria bacterium]|nr:hypothetical protein [Candidatus Daviesbacteria bacterium]